ncbi:hypothetical protein NPIL_62741 [Nephila pilipes]|uniref:Uncharacterized protein n=1 Tax=Nephila pilipes TaxID=299642 RepID=A0A8X6PW51_NEPPI|nr:hypothetical protein NPIL_62741 [Nephila pilipes]
MGAEMRTYFLSALSSKHKCEISNRIKRFLSPRSHLYITYAERRTSCLLSPSLLVINYIGKKFLRNGKLNNIPVLLK